MDELKIPESWTFKDENVAQNFDAHVREQLPWYDSLTFLVATIAKHYLPEKAVAYDIGASTGNLGSALASVINERCIEWTAIDNAPEMQRFYRGPSELVIADALEYSYKPFNFAVCFLSLMFMPVDKRRAWIVKMVNIMKLGGAFIIVDKEQTRGGTISTAIQRSIWDQKRNLGMTSDNIVKKETSLCGIQNPIPVGYFDFVKAVEFFRFGFFVGYIIEKSE